ncbi:ribonuclease H-like domain-containing protein [Tanacetum coccineum]
MHYRLPHPGQGILGPALAINSSQPTTLPSAFSIMPSQDPTWHMDTCASSHLNFNASNLSTIFYKRLFPSVHVGDVKSIIVTNTGHSIIPSHHRPLHLHNVLDYLTRHILLRCDSSGDLYFFSLDKCFHMASMPRISGPTGVNMVCSMWLFKHKFHADGTLSRYKARLVANGSSQQLGVDFDKTLLVLLAIGILIMFVFYKDLYIDGNKHPGPQVAYLLIYVDNIILIASCPALLQQIIGSLNNEFDMIDLGALNYFLGISADRTPTSLFLSQKNYALQFLKRAHMVTCNPSWTPVDIESKLGPEGVPIQDPTLYRSLAGGLQYLTFTHLDLSYALYVSATTSLVGYTDADWVGCPSTRRSTSCYCVFLGDNLLSWSAKRQHTISRSSVKAKYWGVANVVAETAWVHNLLRELHSPLMTATLVYCDNVSSVYMSANPVQHHWTKHIEIDIYFVRDMVTVGHVRVLNVPSHFQFADIFTKGLPSALFEDLRSSLSVRPPPAQTAGAY